MISVSTVFHIELSRDAVILCGRLIVALGVVIHSTELLAAQHSLFVREWLVFPAAIRRRPYLIVILLALRLLAAIAMLLPASECFFVSAVYLLCSNLFLAWSAPYIVSAADQINTLTLTGLLGIASTTDDSVKGLWMWFIAMQIATCYCWTGIFKIAGPLWRSGVALPAISKTSLYRSVFGSNTSALWRIAGYVVIAWEVLFPFCLFTGQAVALLFVLTGVVFHLGVLVTMRLNGFLFACCATYPFVLYVASGAP